MCAQYIYKSHSVRIPTQSQNACQLDQREGKNCRNLTSVCLRFNEIHYVLDNREQQAVREFGPINWPPVIRTESKTYAWHICIVLPDETDISQL